MGFWSRLFGERTKETEAQKIARARAHLDEHEPQLAVRIVERLSGPEVDEIRRRARAIVDGDDARLANPVPRDIAPAAYDRDHEPGTEKTPSPAGAPYRAGLSDDEAHARKQRFEQQEADKNRDFVLQFLAGGAISVPTGDGGSITLNAPQSDDDGSPRSTDGLAVARRLIASTGATPLDPRALAFLDAVRVVARSGEALPPIEDATRRAVGELATAAAARDRARIVHIIEAAPAAVSDELAWFATPLAVTVAAPELGALAKRGLVQTTLPLVEALLPDHVALVEALVARVDDAFFTAEVRIVAEGAGLDRVDVERFAVTDWTEMVGDPAEATWRSIAVRRLVRTDLEQAVALALMHEGEVGSDFGVAFAVASALAKQAPSRVLERLAGRPSVDDAGWLAGAVHARVAGVDDVVDRWIAALGPSTYDPYGYFATALEAAIDLGERARVRRLLERAGPTGWQVACAARDALARCSERDAMLATLYERVTPGIVSSRGIAYGTVPLAAGKVAIQPAWLGFREPHPIETLAIVAALGTDGPRSAGT